MTYTELFFQMLKQNTDLFEQCYCKSPKVAYVPKGTVDCLRSDLKEYLDLSIEKEDVKDYYALGLKLVESGKVQGLFDMYLK